MGGFLYFFGLPFFFSFCTKFIFFHVSFTHSLTHLLTNSFNIIFFYDNQQRVNEGKKMPTIFHVFLSFANILCVYVCLSLKLSISITIQMIMVIYLKQSACESWIEILWSNYVANIDGVWKKTAKQLKIVPAICNKNGRKKYKTTFSCSLTAPK